MRNSTSLHPPAAFWFLPRLSPALKHRSWAALLLSLIFLHAILEATGFGGLGCPFRTLTTIPCPGCGLSTAARLALNGEWIASFDCHPFLPFFAIGVAVIAAGTLLPEGLRVRFLARVEAWEERSRALAWFFGALFAHWILRLLLMIDSS